MDVALFKHIIDNAKIQKQITNPMYAKPLTKLFNNSYLEMEELSISNKEIYDYLIELGCCIRCVHIYAGESSIDNISRIFSTNFSTKEEENTMVSSVGIHDEINPQDYVTKKQKTLICISCLGLLQNFILTEAVQKICNDLNEKGYDASAFTLGISLPICIRLRIHCIWAHLVKRFQPLMSESEARRNHMTLMKDVCKNIIGPQIASIINKPLTNGPNSPLNFTIHFSYTDDLDECLTLEKFDKEKFSLRRKQHRKFAEGVFTKHVMEDILENLSDDQFLAVCAHLPSVPRKPLHCSHIQCSHTSIYLAGRYNKYSRELPQTPWFVEETRRFDSSVQELICEPLNQTVQADEFKFSASGREDVDVRCLGKGRPFIIEFLNPHRTKLCVDELRRLQKMVNDSTSLVKIKDLQLVLKKDTFNLKEGEEEKTKSYCALCFAPEGITEELLQPVNQIQNLTLDQMTPLRVLHRRPLSVRKRAILSARAQLVDKNFFKLHLEAQAGTYIKEFIHGDFGRTIPNLGFLLGIKCDIIALDVENVQLDWPPAIG